MTLTLPKPQLVSSAALALLGAAIVSTSADAQGKTEQGVINYEQTINIHASIPPEQAALKAVLPKEQKIQIVATFSGDTYRLEALQPEVSESGSRFRPGFGDEITIVELDSETQTRIGELVDVKFASRSDLPPLDGLVPSEGKQEILGYDAKRLSGTINLNGRERPVEIWYSDEIPAGISPLPFKGLPGAVLDLKIGKSSQRFSATSIEMVEVDDTLFDVPEGHREITNEQFQDLQAEAIDALRQSGAAIARSE